MATPPPPPPPRRRSALATILAVLAGAVVGSFALSLVGGLVLVGIDSEGTLATDLIATVLAVGGAVAGAIAGFVLARRR